MKPVSLSAMAEVSSWEDTPTVQAHVARQLTKGRVVLAIGSGATQAFDLPGWDLLVDRLFSGGKRPDGLESNEKAAEVVLNRVCGGDRLRFAEKVREALYKDANLDLDSLASKPLLSALGALTMNSVRGSVQNVVSYNFDDLVEEYLGYHAMAVSIVERVPEWPRAEDVRVYHPHGLLRSDPAKPLTGPIVFAASDYADVVGRLENPWSRAILWLFESHFVIFVGLSGDDLNFRSILSRANAHHRSRLDGDLYWGISFSQTSDDPARDVWRKHGIHQCVLDSWDDLPEFLLSIARKAVVLRRS